MAASLECIASGRIKLSLRCVPYQGLTEVLLVQYRNRKRPLYYLEGKTPSRFNPK